MLTAPKTPSWSCFVRTSSRSLSHGMSAACSVCNPSCLLKEKLRLTTSSFHPTVALSLRLSIGKSVLLIMANHFSLLTFLQCHKKFSNLRWPEQFAFDWSERSGFSLLSYILTKQSAMLIHQDELSLDSTWPYFLSSISPYNLTKQSAIRPYEKNQVLLILIIFSSIFL